MVNLKKNVALLVIWFLLAGLALQAAPGTARAQQNGQTISMDFDKVDIRVFIKFISELTGKNFVIDDRIRGRVTILSPRRISAEEAYRVFESVLEVNDFIAVPSGEVTKIVLAKGAKTMALSTSEAKGKAGQPSDTMVTQIIPLTFASSTEVKKLLAPMVSPNGLLTDYPASDTMIVTDYLSNINRLQKIIEAIDVKDKDKNLRIITLNYASASKLAKNLTQIFQSKIETEGAAPKGTAGRATKAFAIVPDDRINALVIVADAAQIEQIETLVAELDQPAPKEQGNIKVYYLENAEAEEMEKTLMSLVGKKVAGAAGKDGQQKEAIIAEGTKIVADKATNSLVINADPGDFQTLENIISQLDIPRKQVFVEALIMEVSADASINYGVNWTIGANVSSIGADGGLVYGASNPNTAGISPFDSSSFAGMAVGIASFPVEIAGVTYQNLSSLVAAGKTDSSFNIISSPQLLTLDNKEASVVVAENRPYLVSSATGQNVNDRTVEQYEYRDVGTELKVTPQISEGGTIRMKLYQQTDRVDSAASEATGVTRPVTRKRTTETTVVVKDGQTMVISGLIGKTSSDSTSKVPGLGDIPILGWLFKYHSESENKTNLLVFLTPRIVAHPREADEIYHEKIKQLEMAQYGVDDRILPLVKPMAIIEPSPAR